MRPRHERDPELLREIGRRVRAAREGACVSRRTLAAATGRDPSLVTYVERGYGGSLETLYSFARALGMRAADLFPEVR